jgi:hypothetical protein
MRIVFDFSTFDRNKLNPEFADRLTQIDPQQKVRVIVLLQVESIEQIAGKRQSRLERQAAIQSVRESAAQVFANIEGIIQHFEGYPLIDRPDALGSIPIEITPAGIEALVKSVAVKAVMEDKSIYQIHSSDSFEISVVP